jgi:hypothetical protein
MLIDMKVWLSHFEYHAQRSIALPEVKNDALTPAELRRIARSIATFQLGEQSEGRSLLLAACEYERAHGAAPLARIIELFIKEEQQHAALLGAFMDRHGIPRKRKDWTDRIFRCVRRLAGLELHLSVLITAELIGKVYYRALECATNCRPLQALCRLMVADELAHVGFESDLLRTMRGEKSALQQVVVEKAHRVFLACASVAVWLTHRPVLRHAGYRMRTFLWACDAQYVFYLQAPKIAHTEQRRNLRRQPLLGRLSPLSSAQSSRAVLQGGEGLQGLRVNAEVAGGEDGQRGGERDVA